MLRLTVCRRGGGEVDCVQEGGGEVDSVQEGGGCVCANVCVCMCALFFLFFLCSKGVFGPCQRVKEPTRLSVLSASLFSIDVGTAVYLTRI